MVSVKWWYLIIWMRGEEGELSEVPNDFDPPIKFSHVHWIENIPFVDLKLR